MELLKTYNRSFSWSGKVFGIGSRVVFVRKDDPYGVDYNEGTISDIHSTGIYIKNRRGYTEGILFDSIDHLVEA